MTSTKFANLHQVHSSILMSQALRGGAKIQCCDTNLQVGDLQVCILGMAGMPGTYLVDNAGVNWSDQEFATVIGAVRRGDNDLAVASVSGWIKDGTGKICGSSCVLGRMTAEELKGRRSALGLSQSEFADLLPMSVRTYQGWESGRFPVPPFIGRLLASVEADLDAGRRALKKKRA